MALIHVVEDNREFRYVITEFLALLNYQVKGFSSAEAYMCYMNSSIFKSPILMLSDVNMPGMCGIQLAYKVRKKHPDMRYVLMTGDLGQLEGAPLSHLKIEEVLGKPFPLSRLKRILDVI